MRQLGALKSARFAQISTFARLPHTRDLRNVKAFFVGIPFDDAVTYRPGARFCPGAIRDWNSQVGGLSSFELVEFQRPHKLDQLEGFDVVEVSPPYDVS